MKIKAKAPARIDLAGGGLDIPPLYLLHEFGLTINVAITVLAEVEIETLTDDKIIIESEDLKEQVFAKSLKNLSISKLELLTRLVRFYRPTCGLKIKTKSASPPGAGLGGSATLALALAGALNLLCKTKYNKEKLIRITSGLEIQTIKVPDGYQDYYSAAYGDFSAVWLREAGTSREKIKVGRKFYDNFERSFLLVHLGHSRFSGINNWQLFKDRIDGKLWAKNYLEKTKQVALKMYQAMKEGNFFDFVRLVGQDEKNRIKYFPKIETLETRQLIKTAKDNGAWTARVCGAGGGGCVLILAPADKLSSVRQAVIKNKGSILSCQIASHGLQIKTSL